MLKLCLKLLFLGGKIHSLKDALQPGVLLFFSSFEVWVEDLSLWALNGHSFGLSLCLFSWFLSQLITQLALTHSVAASGTSKRLNYQLKLLMAVYIVNLTFKRSGSEKKTCWIKLCLNVSILQTWYLNAEKNKHIKSA